jgi:hypothetical protein
VYRKRKKSWGKKTKLREGYKLCRSKQVSVAIISEPGHTRNKKHTAYYSPEEMMHEINVIRSPWGMPFLIVNVPRAENTPRAVSNGWQNYKKAFFPESSFMKSLLSYQEPTP